MLEQGTAELLREAGVGERMDREGIVHHGVGLQFDGERHRIALERADRRPLVVIYGQTEVVKDLIAARLATGRPLLFEVEDVSCARARDRAAAHPLHATTAAEHELECDVIAGCDGFHGVCRPSIPAGVLREF